MTTNKPEVVAYLHTFKETPECGVVSLNHDASCTSTMDITEPLIRLSDYEALQAECEKLRKDAERYRWLRDPCSGAERVVGKMYGLGDYGRGLMTYTMLDEAIDAAMEEDK